jgi:flagellar basal-body rod protein FlgC
MLGSIDVSASALVAQRQRMNTIAGNIANTHTTIDEHGQPNPYQRRFVTFHVDPSKGETGDRGPVGFEVHVDQNTEPRRVYQPQHQHADADGYVSYPAIDMVTEFVNALDASRAYEANVVALDVTKNMIERTLGILA